MKLSSTNKKPIIISILIILLSYSKIYSKEVPKNNQCPIYKNTPLSKSECFYKQTELSFLLHTCPYGKKCQINNEQTKGLCVPSDPEFNKPAYPGGKCSSFSDCLSGDCVNGKCNGSKPGEKCNNHSDCFFGLYCSNNRCIFPLPKSSQCNNDLDCQFPLLCFEGKCTELFSIDNGYKIGGADGLICKSGVAYNGVCNSLENVNVYCDGYDEESNTNVGQCKYKGKNGEEVIFQGEEYCKCEFKFDTNEVVRKKCVNGDRNNKIFEELKLTYKKIISNENIKFCNAEEKRGSFCRETLRRNWDLRNEDILFKKSLILYKYSNILSNDDPIQKDNINNKLLILKNIFGYDDTPPIPDNFKCPKYIIGPQSNFKEKTCAYSINPFNKDGDNITVYINPTPCEFGYKCNYNEKNIYTNWNYNATCEYTSTIKNILNNLGYKNINDYFLNLQKVKFPGEKCDDNAKCAIGNYVDVGECVKNKCSGHDINEECKDHSDCLSGLYCNITNKVCKKLKGSGEYCSNELECKNNYLCMNNTCIEYFSLKNGTYLSDKNTQYYVNLCKFGLYNEETRQCIDNLDYDRSVMKVNKDGFSNCNPDNFCYYQSGNCKIKKKCECGYNKFGNGVCPISHQINNTNWVKYYDLKRKIFDNKCHTLKRYTCIDLDLVDKVNHYKILTEKAHLFYKTDGKIVDVLKGDFVKFSILFNIFCLFILI